MEELRLHYLTRGYFWEVILNNYSGKMAARIRGGHPDRTAPACSLGALSNNGSPMPTPSNLTLILPHSLLDRTRFTR